MLRYPKAIQEKDLSREGDMSTVHLYTELNRRGSVVVEHSFVQSGTREPKLRELYEERLVDNEMATCIYDCHPKTPSQQLFCESI